MALSALVGIISGLITIFSYIPNVREFSYKYKYFKKIISVSKLIIIFIGIFSIILFGIGKLGFIEKNNANKIISLTDPSCLESSADKETIDFEWIIESEEEFESRLAYYIVPFSSGEFNEVPFFEKNWEDFKINIGRNTIKNSINYSDSQKGRYRICAQIINKLNGEEVLETNCCTKTVKTNLE